MHQHVVEPGPHERKVVKRRLVVLVVRGKAPEPKAGCRGLGGTLNELRVGLYRQVEHGGLDAVLAPSIVARAWTFEVRLLREREVQLPSSKKTERVDGLRDGETGRRGDGEMGRRVRRVDGLRDEQRRSKGSRGHNDVLGS